MAEKREIIIEIEVDNNQAQKNLERTTSQLRTLQNERKELNAQIKKSDSQLRAEGTTRKEVNKQIVENQLATKRLSDEKRKATKEVNLENNSLNALRNNLSKLTSQRNNVNTGTKEGAKQFRELNKEIAKQNKEISNLEQAGGDFRRNVGNYGDALNGVIPAFSGVTSSISAMTKGALAFIATPFGAIIAALGLAVGALTQYFKGSEEGQNDLLKITTKLDAVFGIITDTVQYFGKTLFDAISSPQETIENIGKLIQENLINRFKAFSVIGNAIVKILSGDLKEGFKELGNGAIQATTGVENAIDKTKDLISEGEKLLKETNKRLDSQFERASEIANKQAELDRRERDILVSRAKLETQIASLRLKAKDEENSTAEERISFLKQAQALEDKIFSDEVKNARLRLDIKKAENAQSNSTKEDKKEEAQLEADLIRLNEQRLNSQRKLETEIQTNIKKRDAENAKIDADKAKQDAIDLADKIKKAEKEEELRQREIDANIELQAFKQSQREFDAEDEILLEEKKAARLLENAELVESEKQLIKEESNAKILALQKKAVDNEIKEQERQVSQTSALFGDLNSVIKSLGVEFKGLAIAQAVVDTYAAANAALRSGSALSPLAGIAAAAGAVVTGLANVATIKNQKFALGGMVVGPSHANGGVKFAVGGRVNELEGGEAVINKRSTKMFAPVLSAMNVAGGGVKFANGGITDFSSASSIDSEISGQNQIMSLINSLPSPIVRVTDINDTQNTVKVTQETASL